MVRVHVSGLDKFLRDFDRTNDEIEDALTEGTQDAADYLVECIQDKFGVYQPKGGNGGGPWKKLQYATIVRKRKKGNSANANKPLVDSGDAMFSFETQTSNRTRKHTVSIISQDEKLMYHIMGAPDANLPRRDPVRPTLEDERKNCFDMIVDAVRKRVT